MRNLSPILCGLLVLPLMMTSCSKLGAFDASNATVTPQPLEVSADKVPLVIAGRFPEKYFKKNAEIRITPVLHYAGGEVKGHTAEFQGEKVRGNGQEVSYDIGGVFSIREQFPYDPAMIQSDLYLTFDARQKGKNVSLPDVKVGSGVLATATLVSHTAASATPALGADAYRYAIEQRQEAQIRYLIQQSRVRQSELRTPSVEQFVETLRSIKEDAKGHALSSIEISAYASPDGGQQLNKNLAQAREQSSKEYVDAQLRKLDLDAAVSTRYTAQDWEGFQTLVRESNIQDKEVILRVLSMYDDPEEREAQIKNISVGFRELADEILPELRRARLSVNYLLIGRTDAEIQEQYEKDASQLSVEELLYAATLTDNADKKASIYAKATSLYPQDYRAQNNLGVVHFTKGDIEVAEACFDRALTIKKDVAEAHANKALVALTRGRIDVAEEELSQATTTKNYSEVLGNLLIAKGQYGQACQQLAQSITPSAALAQLLNKDYVGADKTLSQLEQPTALSAYLGAIVAARTGLKEKAISQLAEAIRLDRNLKDLAKKDLEFAGLQADAQFQNLLK
ncbi:MAG: hypothetical protein IJ816_02990 [Alloprevotella sp.]|nr:hypothetical protein [Alloprevotella sp.]